MKDYEYQAYVCNNILYTALLNLKSSGIPAEDIPVMLNCMGEALVKMSIENKPIDYYMRNYEKRCESSENEIVAYFKKQLKAEQENPS